MSARNSLKTYSDDSDEISLSNYEANIHPLVIRYDKTLSEEKFCKVIGIIKSTLHLSAIRLFADIFTSSSLNIKNKLQLIKHLTVHT